MAVTNTPVYRVRWGEIDEATLIKESPKTLLVRNQHNHTFRAWKDRVWGHSSGGRLYNTERCFQNKEEAFVFALAQITGYEDWAEGHREEAAKKKKKLFKMVRRKI